MTAKPWSHTIVHHNPPVRLEPKIYELTTVDLTASGRRLMLDTMVQ